MSLKTDLFEYFQYILCLFSGLVLFWVGLVGLTDSPFEPVRELTALLAPSGLGDGVDQLYLSLLTILGFGLTLFIWVRPIAAVAVGLVTWKLALVHGHLVLVSALLLCVALAAILLRRASEKRRGPPE